MALVDLIKEDIIKVHLESETKSEVIKELLTILIKAGKISNLEKAIEAILKREAKGSTGLAKGIAIPHAKCSEVKSLTMAIGISPHGIDFEALDMEPSHLFFIILAPPDQTGPHLEALSEIAKMTESEAFCRTLIEAQSAKEVVELFKVE